MVDRLCRTSLQFIAFLCEWGMFSKFNYRLIDCENVGMYRVKQAVNVNVDQITVVTRFDYQLFIFQTMIIIFQDWQYLRNSDEFLQITNGRIQDVSNDIDYHNQLIIISLNNQAHLYHSIPVLFSALHQYFEECKLDVCNATMLIDIAECLHAIASYVYLCKFMQIFQLFSMESFCRLLYSRLFLVNWSKI
jgi:hypothetical protein